MPLDQTAAGTLAQCGRGGKAATPSMMACSDSGYDVVVIDRGYNQPLPLIRASERGVSVVLRYNPHGMNLYDESMQKMDVYAWLQKQTTCQLALEYYQPCAAVLHL